MVVARCLEDCAGEEWRRGGCVEDVGGCCIEDGCGFWCGVLEVVGAVAVVSVGLKAPVARTSSMILLVVGAAGVGCCTVAATFGATTSFFVISGVTCGTVGLGFGTSFFATVFICAGAFFSATLSLVTAAFALGFFTVVFFPSTCIVPASSAMTFFGRPRFLTAGGAIVVVVDIVECQLIVVVYKLEGRNGCSQMRRRRRFQELLMSVESLWAGRRI
jgi:hypothetical protein